MGWKSGEGGCFGSDALVLLVANQTNARAEEGKTFMVVILYGKSWPGFRRSGRYPFPRECGKVLRQQCECVVWSRIYGSGNMVVDGFRQILLEIYNSLVLP